MTDQAKSVHMSIREDAEFGKLIRLRRSEIEALFVEVKS